MQTELPQDNPASSGDFTTIGKTLDQRVSVILVNYNSADDLRACLQSIQEVGELPGEVIVVDNASTQGVPGWLGSDFPWVKLYCSRQNMGFAGGSNLGAAQARGEFLVFLNPDTRVSPGWLSPLVNALQADPNVGMVTARILILQEPQRVNACGNDIHLTGLTLCRGLGKPAQDFLHRQEVNAVSGACFAVRRALFEHLGGFDENLFMYMEDADLSMRAVLAGYRLVVIPESVIYHDYHLTFGPRKTYFQERNRYWMLFKNMRWATLLVLLPALLLAEGITWGFILLREPARFSNKLSAYAWIARNRFRLLHLRRAVQALRRVPDRTWLRLAHTRLDFTQTGPGPAALLAGWLFNPVFWVLKMLGLFLVWW